MYIYIHIHIFVHIHIRLAKNICKPTCSNDSNWGALDVCLPRSIAVHCRKVISKPAALKSYA